MLVKSITTPLLREFIAKLQTGQLQKEAREKFKSKEKRAVKPAANATINRVLALLRRMMNIAKKDGLIQALPYFPMLKEENVREGFLETDQFKTLLTYLPEHLRPLMVFLFTTGCRLGAALKITWDMLSSDCMKLTLPGTIVKNKKPTILALPAELSAALKATLKKQFRQVGKPMFDGTNLRREWDKATKAAADAPT